MDSEANRGLWKSMTVSSAVQCPSSWPGLSNLGQKVTRAPPRVETFLTFLIILIRMSIAATHYLNRSPGFTDNVAQSLQPANHFGKSIKTRLLNLPCGTCRFSKCIYHKCTFKKFFVFFKCIFCKCSFKVYFQRCIL